MKGMYKDGEYKAVHTCHIESMLADGWSFKPSAESEAPKEDKTPNLTKTHKKALELGLEIYDEEENLIHHKTLAKQIKEALADGDKDEG